MGVQERRVRERVEQRQRILDAALAIISKEGWAALSMRKLAEQVEYSAGSIYLYFENREQLAQELRHFGFEQLLAKLEPAAKKLDGRKALHALGAAYVHFGREQPQLYRLMFMGEPKYMQAAYEGMASDAVADRAYQLLLDVIQTLKGVPGRRAAATKVADVIWSCLHGMVSLHLALPDLQATQPATQQKLLLELLAQGLDKGLKRSS